MDWFYKLNSGRAYEMAPISYMSVVDFGRYKGLDGEMIEFLYSVIESLDEVYITWVNDKIKKDSS